MILPMYLLIYCHRSPQKQAKQILMLNEDNGHLAKVRLRVGNFEDLLYTSGFISKICFEQRGMLHQNYHSFGTKIFQDTVAVDTQILKSARGLLVVYKIWHILVKLLLM